MQAIAKGVRRVQFQDTCLSKATILYCSDLAFACSEDHLCDLFLTVCPHGVRQVSVYRGRNHQPMGYGFVELFAETDVDSAITKLNGVELFGRHITVERFRDSAKPTSTRKYELYIKFHRVNPTNPFVVEADFRYALKNFGTLSAVTVKKQHINSKGCAEGYGFASFDDPTVHLRFTESHQLHVDDIHYHFRLSESATSPTSPASAEADGSSVHTRMLSLPTTTKSQQSMDDKNDA